MQDSKQLCDARSDLILVSKLCASAQFALSYTKGVGKKPPFKKVKPAQSGRETTLQFNLKS